MKNLRKLTKRDLKTITRGSVPLCDAGFTACRVRDENEFLIWECSYLTTIINNEKGTSENEVPSLLFRILSLVEDYQSEALFLLSII